MTTAVLERVKPQKYENHGIREILHDLVIDPFDNESVKKYKEKMLKSYAWRIGFRDVVEQLCNFLMTCSAIGFVLNYILNAVWLVAEFKLGVETIPMTTLATRFLLPFGACICAFFFAMGLNSLASVLGVPSWNVIWEKDYKEPIPEFVQQTIDDIKAKYNGYCAFKIDALTLEKIPLDPFLRIETSEGVFYIEVWNESYQKQREI